MRMIAAGGLLVAGLSGVVQAAEVEGVKLADRARVTAAGPELVLNGAGVRTRFFFRVYVGALYLEKKETSAMAVIANPGPKRIALHLLRELTAEQLFSAMNDGLKANHTPEDVARFGPQVAQLEGIFNAVKVAKPGDTILLDYVPDTGTTVAVNGDPKGRIPGGEFNRALLRIWLGDQPADGSLQRAMLGG